MGEMEHVPEKASDFVSKCVVAGMIANTGILSEFTTATLREKWPREIPPKILLFSKRVLYVQNMPFE